MQVKLSTFQLSAIAMGVFTNCALYAAAFDYDGDGIADVAVRRASTFYWYVKNSGTDNFNSSRQDGIQREKFGLRDSDIPVPADYDGDGITDFAVRRSSNYTWYVLNSSGDNTNSSKNDGIQREVFGQNDEDIPVAADYDGDGIADFAVRRPSNYTWYVKNSSGGNYNSANEDGIQRIVFGQNSEDIPVPGFYDEDNIADFAVYRNSNNTWYVKNSSGTNYNSSRSDAIQRVTIGQDGDIPVPADYDGDGITDFAVRTPSSYTWTIRESSTGETVTKTFGRDEADIPVPADYDGDGKADIAVRRGSNQIFYILNSSDGEIQRISFGAQEDDIPVNAPITEVIAKLNAVLGTDSGSNNTKPVADAGSDQTVELGSTVQLNGSNSSDSDGDSLTYSWSFSSKPSGSDATFSSNTAQNPTFIADVAGVFSLSLVVDDGTTSSDSDSVSITVEDTQMENTPPVANAGANQSVSVGATVTLDGSSSSDADGDSLTYSWEMTSKPASSNASLNGSTSVNPTFVPDISGDYSITLVVNDGTDNSAQDSVTVTASNNDVDITDIEFSNRSGNCAEYVGTYYSNVTDVQRSVEFTGNVEITADDSKCYMTVNEIPNHDFNDTGSFASNVSEQTDSFEIDRSPSFANTATALAMEITNAVTLNGVTVDLLSAACYDVGNEPIGEEKIGCGPDQINNPWRYDPMSSLNSFGTDSHNAHPQPDGTYHYHGDPVAMYDVDCEANNGASPVIGFAADSFPIFGPCFNDNGTVRKAESSFVLKDNGGQRQSVSGYTTPEGGVGNVASNNYDGQFIGDWEYQEGAGDLDECNGMTVDGQYGYYVTDSYPWIMACLKGNVDSTFNEQGDGLQNLLHRHDPSGNYHRH